MASLKSWLRNWWKQETRPAAPARKGARRRGYRPALESLEDRRVPTILFVPKFGAETLAPNLPKAGLTSPPVFVVFWGSYWGTSAGRSETGRLWGNIQTILGGPYTSRLSQYGGDGKAIAGGTWTVAKDPGSAYNPKTAQNFFNGLLDQVIDDPNSHIPRPTTPAHTPIYVVVTDPNAPAALAGAAGYNGQGTYLHINPISDEEDTTQFIWASTSFASGGAAAGINTDVFTSVFSHELAEAISDPNGAGGITPPPMLPASLAGSAQIGDNEPDARRYGYRLNGVVVQPYWSADPADQKYIVPDGNTQSFTLDPKPGWIGTGFSGRYDLTFSTPAGSSVTLDKLPNGNLQVQVNGQTATFDPVWNQLNSITIQSGGGNFLYLKGNLPGVPITFNGGGNESVFVYSTAVNSPVTLHLGGGSSSVALNANGGAIGANLQTMPTIDTTGVYDLSIQDSGAAGFAGKTVTLTSNSLSGLGPKDFTFDGSRLSGLAINEQGQRDYHIVSIPGVNVLGQWVTTSLGRNAGQAGNNTITLGSGGKIASVRGHLRINDFSSPRITFDDSGDTSGAESWTLQRSDLLPNRFEIDWNEGSLIYGVDTNPAPGTLTLKAGGSVTVNDAGAPTTIIGNTGRTAFDVSGASWPVQIDSHGGQDSVNVHVQRGLAGVTVNDFDAFWANVSVTLGHGAASFPASPVTINGNGLTHLTVHDAGALPVDPSGNVNPLSLFFVGAAELHRTAANPGFDRASVAYGKLGDLVVNPGLGLLTEVFVAATPFAYTTVQAGPKAFFISVGNNGTLADIKGTLILQGGTGKPSVVIDDSADTGSHLGATLGLSGLLFGPYVVSKLAPANIYVDTAFSSLNLNPGPGTLLTVQDTPVGVTTHVNLGHATGRALLVTGTSGPLVVDAAGTAEVDLGGVPGTPGRLDGLHGDVTLGSVGSKGQMSVIVNDRGATQVKPNAAVTGVGLTGLAPAVIHLLPGTAEAVLRPSALVRNTIRVSNAFGAAGLHVTIDGGPLGDAVTVAGTGGLSLLSVAQVQLGVADTSLLRGPIDVGRVGLYQVFAAVTVDNSAGVGHTVTVDRIPLPGGGIGGVPFSFRTTVDGLAPGQITLYPGAKSLLLEDGYGSAIARSFSVPYTVKGTSVDTRLVLGKATVNVLGTSARLEIDGGSQVTVGNGTLQNILGSVLVGPEPSAPSSAKPLPLPQLVVDDRADKAYPTVGLAANPGPFDQAVTGLTPTPLVYASTAVASLAVRGGPGGTAFQVQQAPPGVPVTLVGGGTSSLQGPDSANTWQITGRDAGTLNGSVAFQKVQSLVGGSADDTFGFHIGGSLSGSLDGRGGVNTLDYSAYDGGVQVNLQLGTATAVTGAVQNIQKVRGSRGNDILVGAGKGEVLTGGTGRNVLIAGPGPGTLEGGPGDDILVGGSTPYDQDPAALAKILAEWSGADAYSARVDLLLGGLGGTPMLNERNFTPNTGGNTLTGAAGLDLFFGSLARDKYDWDLSIGEVFVEQGQVHAPVRISINASALGTPQNPTPLYLDGIQQAATVIAPNLLPGRHSFGTYGGSSRYFDVAADGTLSLENPKLGAVSGNGLTITGVAVDINAGALGTLQNPTPLYLDGILQSGTVITPNLLPGRHAFASYGGAGQYFDIADDGTLTLENSLDGSVSSSALTITGKAVTIDASALGTAQNPTPLYLDGILQAATVITAHLLPGRHAFASYGGAGQYFDIADDGTLSLENPKLGAVSGNTLTFTGVTVKIDASPLGTPLFVDGIEQTSPVITTSLLPGRHAFASLGGSSQYFDIADDGTLTLENPRLGAVTGNSLTITGVAVKIDASAVGVSSLTLDGKAYQAAVVDVNVLPGRHFFSVPGSSAALYFDVGDGGLITIPDTESGILSVVGGTTLLVNRNW
jgi:hypothetical protein